MCGDECTRIGYREARGCGTGGFVFDLVFRMIVDPPAMVKQRRSRSSWSQRGGWEDVDAGVFFLGLSFRRLLVAFWFPFG